MFADYKDLPRVLQSLEGEALAFHKSLSERPVAARYDTSVKSQALPEKGEGALSALRRAVQEIVPGLSGSPGPRSRAS